MKNYNEELSSTDIERLDFIKNFQNLLDNQVEPESTNIHKIMMDCESLIYKIRDILERMKALDILNKQISMIDLYEQEVEIPFRRFLEQCRKPWLQDKLTIALMGHLKTGKTSVLNCYFGEEFPTSSEEATALSTYLYYGQNPDQISMLVDKDGNVQKITENQLQLFSFETSFNFPFSRMFNYIAKASNHSALKKMTFIDTPGLFSSNLNHADSTYKVLDYCDVVFWFVDCRRSISVREIEFLKNHIADKSVYIIFSFVDALGTTEAGIIHAQNIIKQTIEKNGIIIQGYLQFGRKQITQENFKKELSKTIKALENIPVVKPINKIINFLDTLQEGMLNIQLDVTKGMNQNKKERDEIGNKITEMIRNADSTISTVAERFTSMLNTLDNKCKNVIFCTGGAYNTLRMDVYQLAGSLKVMAEAWDNVDYDIITEYGVYVANLERVEDINQRLESIRSDINEVSKEIKKLKYNY